MNWIDTHDVKSKSIKSLKEKRKRKKFPELNSKSDILINLVTLQFLAYYITAVLLVCYDIFFRDDML